MRRLARSAQLRGYRLVVLPIVGVASEPILRGLVRLHPTTASTLALAELGLRRRSIVDREVDKALLSRPADTRLVVGYAALLDRYVAQDADLRLVAPLVAHRLAAPKSQGVVHREDKLVRVAREASESTSTEGRALARALVDALLGSTEDIDTEARFGSGRIEPLLDQLLARLVDAGDRRVGHCSAAGDRRRRPAST